MIGTKKTANIALLLMMAAILCCQSTWAGTPPDGGVIMSPVEPDFYLSFTPSMPSPGQKVTVDLVSQRGLPPGSAIRWNLSGAPFGDAGVDRTNGARYLFTPNGPGSYSITAELFNAQGVFFGSSSLEIVIGGGFVTRDMGGPSYASEMYLGVMPAQPRIGQTTTFTMHFGSGIPAGGTVRWDVSGGQAANVAVTGANREVCSFVPGIQAQYFVRATLHDAQGALLGEVSLGFIPVP